MIRYDLECHNAHAFDGWFANSGAFDKQAQQNLISCPTCGSTQVSKAIMAPHVRTTKGKDQPPSSPHAQSSATEENPVALSPADQPGSPPAAHAELLAAMRKVREIVKNTAEYVGPKFAEEARKIHYEETDNRSIYGEASPRDVKQLHDEGIDVHPLPVLPEDKN